MDMIFRQQAKIDWQLLKHQPLIQDIVNDKKENKNRVPHDYKVGDLVLIVQKSYEHKKKANSPPLLKDHSQSSKSTQMEMYPFGAETTKKTSLSDAFILLIQLTYRTAKMWQ